MNSVKFLDPLKEDWNIDLVGEPAFEPGSSISISDKVVRIINYQFQEGITNSSIKGFLFHGVPGVGKTITAKKITHDLKALLSFVDGSTIARHLYGDSEQQIKDIFDKARNLPNGKKCIILLDDVESLFMSRGAMELVREWHFSQNSVFFHEVDDMDTSKCAIILTTNRPDLVDEAIRDRFYNIEFPKPPIDTLLEILKQRCINHGMNDKTTNRLLNYLQRNKTEFNSIRDVLRYFQKEYIDEILCFNR